MKVIGVVGQNGSGKDEVLKYLEQKFGIPFFSTGDMVREIAANQALEPTRENLKTISEKYFAQYGKGYFVKLLAERIRQSGNNATGITGIRSPDDVSILRQAFGPDFILIDVFVTNDRARFDRMQKRAQARDPKSLEQFLAQDRAEEELFHVKVAEKMADFTLSNDASLEDLHRAIADVFKGVFK